MPSSEHPPRVPAPAGWWDAPLLACLAVQVFLLGFRLNVLSMWTDELGSLTVVRQPVAAMLRFVATDIHPPLYFLMLHYWLKLPLGGNPVLRMRLLSVLCALAATVAVDRLWARRLPGNARLWFLALWASSPCLLLYSRMARSYSLQLLVAVAAAYALWHLIERPGRRALSTYAAALALVLYTHYIPGIALGAAGALLLARRRRWRDLFLSSGLALVAYLPWLAVLIVALWKWTQQTGVYALAHNSAIEMAIKAAFGCISFSLGESVPDWALAGGLLLSAPVAWLVWLGLRRDPTLAWLVVPMALIAFIGVARWVPFHGIPARLLFIFPFYLILLTSGWVSGREAHPRTTSAILAFLALLSCAGVWSYFERSDFLNKGYAVPYREIALHIARASTPGQSLVLADGRNTDAMVFQYYLGPDWNVLFVTTPESLTRAVQLAADPRVERIWYLRNTHDVTPGRVNDALERDLTATWIHGTRQFYLPFSPLQRKLARRLGMPSPPSFFQVLLDLHR